MNDIITAQITHYTLNIKPHPVLNPRIGHTSTSSDSAYSNSRQWPSRVKSLFVVYLLSSLPQPMAGNRGTHTKDEVEEAK